jgi:hypothetical protein
MRRWSSTWPSFRRFQLSLHNYLDSTDGDQVPSILAIRSEFRVAPLSTCCTNYRSGARSGTSVAAAVELRRPEDDDTLLGPRTLISTAASSTRDPPLSARIRSVTSARMCERPKRSSQRCIPSQHTAQVDHDRSKMTWNRCSDGVGGRSLSHQHALRFSLVGHRSHCRVQATSVADGLDILIGPLTRIVAPPGQHHRAHLRCSSLQIVHDGNASLPAHTWVGAEAARWFLGV